MNKVIVITGPTASGKTAVSIQLAGKLEGEIINADSMQIYKRCDIGSAKPLIEEKKGIKHHLIDIIEPYENFSVAEYKAAAKKCISEIIQRGKTPVITGGTGLYIDAIVRNIDFSLSSGNTGFREKLGDILKSEGAGYIHGILEKRDPEAAKTVHPNNTRRVIRYLEILDGFNGTLKDYMGKTTIAASDYEYRMFILNPGRELIYKQAEKRVDRMLEAGLVEEVRGLLESGVNENSQCMMGIGYKETVEYIKGNLDINGYCDLLKRNTRRYAKRQFTWLKRYEQTHIINIDENMKTDQIVKLIYDEFTDI